MFAGAGALFDPAPLTSYNIDHGIFSIFQEPPPPISSLSAPQKGDDIMSSYRQRFSSLNHAALSAHAD
jgi:hypothetical protein